MAYFCGQPKHPFTTNPKNSIMAQFGKSNSSKKGKPSYFMAILGVTIVLLIWGIIGLIVIYINKAKMVATEKLEMNVYMTDVASQKDIDGYITFLRTQPYTNDVKFTDKETGKKSLIGSGDTTFKFDLLDFNPIPNTVSFTLKSQYIQKDSMAAIKASLETNEAQVRNVQFSDETVVKIGSFFRQVRLILLIVAIVLSILVVFLIDNTIKLAMYSNRFIIKTMQMVGATRWFIAKPMDKRALINGILSGLIAIALLSGLVLLFENLVPDLVEYRDTRLKVWLFLSIFIVGIVITLFSTHRSVIKYLKMKLDDLY
jgi:cell division transport system permease protein